MKRFLIALFSLFAFLIAVVIFLPYEKIAVDQVAKQLKKYNIELKKMEFSRLDLSGLVIEEFALENNILVIEKLKVNYSLDSLKNKSIESLSIGNISMDKEALLKKFQQEKKNENNEQSELNLEELVQGLPFDDLEIGIKNLNGLHSELRADYFPLMARFSKKNQSLELNVDKGRIDHFGKGIKELTLSTAAKISLKGKQVSLFMDRLEISMGENQASLQSPLKIQGEYNSKDPLLLSHLKGDFTLNWKSLQDTPYLTGMTLKSSFNIKGDRLEMDNTLSHSSGSFKGNISGWVRVPDSERGKLTVKASLEDMNRENLEELSPFITKYIKKLDGRMDLEGMIFLASPKSIPKLTLEGKGLGFQWEETKVKNINFSQNLRSFKTMRSFAANKFSIEEIDMGPIIKNLKGSYYITKPDDIDLYDLSFETYGGKVIFNPCKIRKQIPEDLIVSLRDFPLKKFLEMGLKDGVDASGEFGGELPIVFEEKIPMIKDGKLKNSTKGFIKYNPKTANPLKSMNQIQTNILLEYLENFSYDQLTADVNSDKKFAMVLNTKFVGINKDKYKHNLKLGINLNLNIMDSIRASLVFMKIPKLFEKKLINAIEK